MPSWKKLVVSGSDATLNSLQVTTNVTAAAFSGSFSGSFQGDGSGLTNLTVEIAEIASFPQTFSNTSSVLVNHDLDTSYPLVQVYSGDDEQLIPLRIKIINSSSVQVDFSSNQSGYVIVAKGGHIISGTAGNAALLEGQPGSYYLDYNNFTNIPAGLVSGSDQLTGSYDQRYVLSGSITQTTWDNIANKPAGIVSSSTQVQLDQITGTTFSASNFTFLQDLIVQGKLTAQEFHTELISSSIIYESGSTKFGDSLDDIHSFTGSLEVLGGITGSILATNGILSSSAQIASEISGAFTDVSQSIASDISGLILDSGSFSIRVTDLENFSASLDNNFVSETEFASATGSFLTTASISDDTITLTKGNGTTFNLTVDNVENATSASYVDWTDIDNVPVGIVSSSSQVSYLGLSDIPVGILSSSAQIASEISGAFTSVSESIALDIAGLVQDSGSFSTRITDLENFSSSADSIFVSEVEFALASGSFLVTASVSDDTITLVKGDSSTFNLIVDNVNSASYAGNADLLDGRDSLVFATTGSNTFIGDQIITGSVFVNTSGEVFVDNFPLYQQSLQDAFTGVVSGGIITINQNYTQAFNISSGSGYVIDNYNDSGNPQYTFVTWPNLIVTASAFPSSGSVADWPRTNIAIDASGNVFEKQDKFTALDYREKIVLGRIVHVNSTVITRTLSLPLTTYGRGYHWFDLANSIGPINITGNIYSAGGTDRTIQKSAGNTYRVGSNYRNNPAFPDITTDTSVNPVSFRYRYRNGVDFVELPSTTVVTGSLYDNGSGTLQTVNNNQWTVQRIFFFGATETTIIQFGQFVYNSKVDAQVNATSEEFIADPNLADDSILRGYLIIRGGATDLSSPSDAEFLEATGGGASGGGGGGAISLEGLTDVDFPTSPVNGEALVFSGSIWVNGFPTTSSFATTASYVEYNNVANKPTLVSGSSQIILIDTVGNLSGSRIVGDVPTAVSSSYATFAETAPLDQLIGTTFSASNFTFPQDLTVQGKITAQEFYTELISSSIIYESGSTKFGDTLDDVHSFTGSLEVFGGITGSLLATNGILSSSAQIATEISGAFTSVSQSIALDIAGLVQDSGSFSTRITDLENFSSSADSIFVSEVEFALASGSFLVTASISDDTITLVKGDGSTFNLIVNNVENAISASYVDWTDIDNVPVGIVSSSAQIASDISGSFTSVSQSIASDIADLVLDSGSFSTRITNLENFSASLDSDFVSEVEFALASGSFLTTASISDDTITLVKGDSSSFNLIVNNVDSASFATTASYIDWTDIDNVPVGILSSSAQLNNSTLTGMIVSGSFSGSFQGDGSGLTGVTVDVGSQTTIAQTFTNTSSILVAHNLDTLYPLVQVYNNDDEQVIPQLIKIINSSSIQVEFPTPESGYVVVAKGGHIVSGTVGNTNLLDNQPGSYYLDYNNFTNVPAGIISSSNQIDEFMVMAVSDETTSLTTGSGKLTFRVPFKLNLYQIPRASLTSGSTSGNVVVDINSGSVSILGGTKLTVDQGQKTSKTSTSQTTLASTVLTDDAEITIDVDSAGTAATGLKVILYYRKG